MEALTRAPGIVSRGAGPGWGAVGQDAGSLKRHRRLGHVVALLGRQLAVFARSVLGLTRRRQT